MEVQTFYLSFAPFNLPSVSELFENVFNIALFDFDKNIRWKKFAASVLNMVMRGHTDLKYQQNNSWISSDYINQV